MRNAVTVLVIVFITLALAVALAAVPSQSVAASAGIAAAASTAATALNDVDATNTAAADEMNARARRSSVDACRVLHTQFDAVPLPSGIPCGGDASPGAVVRVANSCEDGLPHTSDARTVVLPQDVVPSRALLRHEAVHLAQRRAPSAWSAAYAKAWGWPLLRSAPRALPHALAAKRRANPDTAAAPWSAWRGRWVPVPVFDDVRAPRVSRAHVEWWDATTGAVSRDLPPGFVAMFGDHIAQPEHPAEVAAELLADEDATDDGHPGRRAVAALRAAWQRQI